MIIDKNKKFKTIVISVRFKEQLNSNTAELRALLPEVMSSATPLYNTRKKVNEALEDLYGSSIGTANFKVGTLSVVDFTLQMINPSYMEEGFFEVGLKILNDIIFGHKNLPKKYFNQEKRLLIERIESLKNNKTAFALNRLYELMFKDETYGIKTSGSIEKVKNLTYENLNKYYFDVIKNNDYDVIISGDVEENIITLVTKYFKPRNIYGFTPIDSEDHLTNELNIVKEQDYVNQVKLNLGYNFPIQYNSPLYYGGILFNIIFGSSTFSRLFKVVREKHSLCYYINSNFDPYKGFLYVYAGIDKNKIELAIELINKELEDLQTNLVSDLEFDLAKKQYINSAKEVLDNQGRTLSSIYQERLLGRNNSLENKIEVLNKVTKTDILNAAKKVTIDTIYMLEPEVLDGKETL